MDSYGVDTNMDMVLTGSENETLACTKDNTYSFSANGTIVRNNGTLKCSSEPTTETDINASLQTGLINCFY